MIITKTALGRRTFLRGVGATLALPMLDAMVPALSAAPPTASRLGFVYVPNGMSQPYWRLKGDTTNELSTILSPLAAAKNQMVVVSGLSNFSVEGGGGPHTRCHEAWLTGMACKRTEGADVELAVTADQIAAKVLGQDTPLLSLELATEPNFIVGNCDNGYSCVYVNTFSWRTPKTPNPMENNPRAVFERLFGDGGSATARLAEMRRDRSILDSVREDMARLQKRIGPRDRAMVADYLEAVREVEQRIQKVEQQNAASPIAVGDKPSGVPNSFNEHATLMFDLMFLAYHADVTRVVSYQLSREQTNRPYPEIGVDKAHHDVSHHQNNPEKLAQHARINTYHVQLFSRLVEKLRTTPDGDGTLLDHVMLLYGAGMGDADLHSPLDLPLMVVGGGDGRLKGGRHLKYPVETPMANLLLGLLHKVGVEQETLGDSTGMLAGL